MKFLSTEVQMGLKKRGRTLEENEDLATANEEKGSVPLLEDVFVSVKSPVNFLLAPVEDVTFSDSEEYRYVLDNVVGPQEDDNEEEYRYYLDNIYNLEEDEEDLGVEDVAEDPLIGDVAEDPQYKYFLDNVRAGETCYVIEIPEENICIEYPDVALTIASEAQKDVANYSGKRRGRKPKCLGQMVKNAHDVHPKAQNHACEYRKRGRKPKNSGQDMVKDSHDVSQKAQNHVGNYNGKRRGRKPKELRNDAVKGSNGIDISNSRASEAKKNDHVAKGDHIRTPPGIEIKVKEEIEDDDDALCKRRRKGPSLNLEHFWHDDKANANKYTNYREKLMQELMKPYSEEEYTRLLIYVKGRKPVEYHRECPNGSKRSYLGKSLLNHHVDLTNKMKSARADKPKALNLLRGFLFWLTHCADDDAFKPWIDPRCCFPASQK